MANRTLSIHKRSTKFLLSEVIIMIFANIFLDFILILLSYVVPKKKNLILFGAALGRKYNGDPKYLIEYLAKHNEDRLSFNWITKERKILNELEKKKIPVCYQYSFLGLYNILRSELIIIDFIPKDVLPFGETTWGRFKYINTWHGTPLKKIGKRAIEDGYGRKFEFLFKIGINQETQIRIKKRIYNYMLSFNSLIAASDFLNKQYETIYESKSIHTLGAPRNDALFEIGPNQVFHHYSLKAYKNIFLYAPTWRDHPTSKNPFSDKGLQTINSFLKEFNSKLFIKSHPLDNNFDHSIGNYSNIKNISHEVEDIYDILKYTTCLITDYSGSCFDFVLTNRPIIFYRYDHDDYIAHCRSFFKSTEKYLPGPFVDSESQLLDKMRTVDSWFNDTEYQNRYLHFKNQFHKYQNGGYCKAFINTYFKDFY